VGSLAPCLQLNATTGDVSGTPTTAGLYQFNIKATDTTAPTQFTFEKPYTLLITPAT
jgi:large repetitive protein